MRRVAVGVLRDSGKILACQRRATVSYPLKWEFPGGKVEEGESPREALRRELHEELGIDASIGREFHTQEWTYPGSIAGSKSDGSFRVSYFLVETYAGAPVNRVFEQIRWVTPDELSSMDILEGNHEAVAFLRAHEPRTRQA